MVSAASFVKENKKVQHGRESANLIAQIFAEDQPTIKSNSSTLEEELELLNEEVRKETKENLEWKKLHRVMELAKKKKQKDTEHANRKKQKEMELTEKRKLKELQLAEKKRQKEIEQAEKKMLREEIQNLKKNKAVKQQLELSLTVSISPPLQMKHTENVDNDSASVGTLMSVTIPKAMTETKAVNKPSAVLLAVEAAAQSDPISTGENSCGMENVKRHKSKEKKIYEKFKKNDDNRENKKDINKWNSFFKQFKSYSHIDSINGSLRRVESKHTYTKKEKQQISKSKGGYVENSNINENFSTNNSTKGRRDLKIKNKELKKKKKKGNKDENVSKCAFTTVNSVSSVHQTTPTNNNEDDNLINKTNIIPITTKASEDPTVKITSSKSTPVIVNSSHQMKQSNGSTVSKRSKNKNREIVGDSNNDDHSIIDNTIIRRSTSKASESTLVKTASPKSPPVIVNSSHQIKQRASNGSTASKISKSKKGKIVGDNKKENHRIIDNNIKRSTKVRASESPVDKTASFKSASITVSSSHQMKQWTSFISLTSKISKKKIEEIVGNNNEGDSIIDNTNIQSTIKAKEDPVVRYKSASVMANPILQMDQRTSTSLVVSKISKSNKVERVCENIKKDVSIINNTEVRSTSKANEGQIVKRESSKSAPVLVKSSHLIKQRISNHSIASKISKSKKGDKVCRNNKKNINIINSIIQSIIKASEGPVVKTGSSKSIPVVNPSLLKQPASNNSNTRKLSKYKKTDRGGDDGYSSVLNNGSQSSKGSKSKKINESEINSRNSKTKETPSAKESKRSTHSIVNVCSNNQSKKVSVIEDDIVVKELEKIEKERLDRASGVKQSDAGDGPVEKQSLVFMARRNWRQRRISAEEEPVVQPDEEKPENEHERERIPCKKFLEELTSNPEHGVDVTLSHNLLVLVKLCMFYLKQSMKVMKNFCFIITKDERDPEVTCLTETVGQVVKVFWVMGKEVCKCLQCEKNQRQNINEQCM